MELETLFTASKWGILEVLSRKPSSPLEIANELGTTIANISQQMRLLEASGLVVRTKVQNSEAGKPRALFTLKEDFAFVAAATDGVAKKAILPLSNSQVYLTRVWMLGEPSIVDPLSKFYFSNNIDHDLYFKQVSGNTIKLETTKGSSYSKPVTVSGKKYTVQVQKVTKPTGEVLS